MGSYNMTLVALSLLMAVFASGMALQTAHIARVATQRLHRHIAIISGTIALGVGIWSMHFIGMLSFELCTPVYYDPATTLLSMVPSLGASWVALQLLSRHSTNRSQLLLGGVLIAMGIAVMHYSGMSAMRMAAVLRYEPYSFFLSILIAVVLATFALGIRFHLPQFRLSARTRIIISAVLMGLAISGLHYIGMISARFIGDNNESVDVIMFNTTYASIALSSFTFAIIVLVVSSNTLIRYRSLYQRLESSESHIRAILDTTSDAIFTLDEQGHILSSNLAAEMLFGWPPSSLQRQTLKQLISEPDYHKHAMHLQRLLNDQTRHKTHRSTEVMGLHRSGRKIPMRMFTGLVTRLSNAVFVIILSDISRYRKMADSLLAAAQQAEADAQTKTLFLANISHELRTPLNAILGFSEILLKEEKKPTTSRHLHIIHDSAKSLLALLNDILDSTKLERGSFMLEEVSFSLKNLCQQVYASMRLIAQSKELQFGMELDPNLADYYLGDPLRIQQILNNLLGNAIKFTEKGHVHLSVKCKNGGVVISVSDTGIGMTQEQLERVFQPFAQADSSISRRFGGTGLGITIVHQLIEAMQGKLHVNSVLNQGSEFVASIPLLSTTQTEDQRATIRSTLPALNILLVDDLPLNLELAQLHLEQSGHTVTCAQSGKEALQLLEKHRFDLVLMDVHMPDMDGLEATRQWREQERTQKRHPIPFIALTASVMQADQRAAQEAGMNGFTSKPLNIHHLYAEMHRVLMLNTPEHNSALTRHIAEYYDPNELINWAQGAALWGTVERLQRAIVSFLQEIDHRYPLMEVYTNQPNWEALLASLHGIAGATANLGLETTSHLARRIEQRIRQGDVSQSLSDIARLQQQLNQTSQLLQHITPADDAPSGDPVKISRAQVLIAIQDLIHHLKGHEIHDSSLKTTERYLQQNQLYTYASALRHALDDFNFQQACELLSRLHAQIEAYSDITEG